MDKLTRFGAIGNSLFNLPFCLAPGSGKAGSKHWDYILDCAEEVHLILNPENGTDYTWLEIAEDLNKISAAKKTGYKWRQAFEGYISRLETKKDERIKQGDQDRLCRYYKIKEVWYAEKHMAYKLRLENIKNALRTSAAEQTSTDAAESDDDDDEVRSSSPSLSSPSSPSSPSSSSSSLPSSDDDDEVPSKRAKIERTSDEVKISEAIASFRQKITNFKRNIDLRFMLGTAHRFDEETVTNND